MYYSTGNHRIYYTITHAQQGRGAVIIMVHGWGGSHTSMIPLAQQISPYHTCITLDLPGFGDSDNPPPEWGIGEYAQCVQAFITMIKSHFPHQEIVYFGHSFGGGIGIYLAAKAPSLFDKLILCGSAFKRKPAQKVWYSPFINHIEQTPAIRNMWQAVRIVGYALFFRNSDMIKYPHLQSNFKKIVHEDISHLLPHIPHYTLILWGTEDTYTPIQQAYHLKQHIPKSVLEVYPKVRHNLPTAHADLIAKPITTFLAKRR